MASKPLNPIGRKLDGLATIIGQSDMESRPVPLEFTSVQEHLKQAHTEACAELLYIAEQLIKREDSKVDRDYARRIHKAQVTLKLIGGLYFEDQN